MINETTQPLREQPARSKNDTELVGRVLGGEAAEEMGELVGDQTEESPTTPSDLKMSADEISATQESDVSREERIHEFCEWIRPQLPPSADPKEYLRLNDFIFNPDGTVDINRRLYLLRHKFDNLPKGINCVYGDCDLSYTQMKDLSNLPKCINGDLNLVGVHAKTIPHNIEISGHVLILQTNNELMEDAKAKGYKVMEI